MGIEKIGFGGGCHWCTEAVFQSLKGVEKVEQGWIASNGNYSSFSEAVIIHYDRTRISLNDLIYVHLETHSSSSNHSMREKYRSAIYYFDNMTQHEIEEVLTVFRNETGRELITKTLPFVAFKANKENYQSYYQKNPEKAFCQRYISPKLEMLTKKYAQLIAEN